MKIIPCLLFFICYLMSIRVVGQDAGKVFPINKSFDSIKREDSLHANNIYLSNLYLRDLAILGGIPPNDMKDVSEMTTVRFNGSVLLDHLRFARNFIITSSRFAKQFEIRNSKFLANTHISTTLFEDTVTIINSTFFGEFEIVFTGFKGDTYITNCVFDSTFVARSYILADVVQLGAIQCNETDFTKKVSFNSTEIAGAANFQRSIFHDTVDFSSTHFKGEVMFNRLLDDQGANGEAVPDFTWSDEQNIEYLMRSPSYREIRKATTFHGYADFKWARFYKTADFFGVEFKTVDFRGSHFDSIADFRKVVIQEAINFDLAELGTVISFEGMKLYGTISFNRTFLPKSLILRNITAVKNIIDLNPARLNNKYKVCNINLTGSDLTKIRLQYLNFQLYFDSTDTYEDRINVYEQLLANQQSYGYLDSYEKLDKEYRSFKLKAKGRYVSDFIQRVWWGYGYDKFRIIINSLLLFFFFVIINSFLLKQLNEKAYKIDKLWVAYNKFEGSGAAGHKRRKLNWGVKQLTVSLFYTAFVFWGLKLDFDKFHFPARKSLASILLITFLMLQYLVGIVCLAYLAHVILTIR